MSVNKAERNQGMGKALLEALIEWAEREPLLEKLRLEVFATNERARSRPSVFIPSYTAKCNLLKVRPSNY